jgi:hypothetical protein
VAKKLKASTSQSGEAQHEIWQAQIPKDALTLGPKVVVRHARDPELKERYLLNKLNKKNQPRMAAHSIGKKRACQLIGCMN